MSYSCPETFISCSWAAHGRNINFTARRIEKSLSICSHLSCMVKHHALCYVYTAVGTDDDLVSYLCNSFSIYAWLPWSHSSSFILLQIMPFYFWSTKQLFSWPGLKREIDCWVLSSLYWWQTIISVYFFVSIIIINCCFYWWDQQ